MLILVRGIFRVVEHIQGNAGYLLRYKIWLYMSDSLLMLGVVVLFNVVHVVGRAGGRSAAGKGAGGRGQLAVECRAVADRVPRELERHLPAVAVCSVGVVLFCSVWFGLLFVPTHSAGVCFRGRNKSHHHHGFGQYAQ